MIVYLCLFFILIASLVLRNPQVIGYLGEQNVRRKLDKLDPKQYFTIHDVLIPTAGGKTSQIDHLVISAYGIFVLETKNYKGWIFGQENSQYWTQTIYKRKEKLLNPILQNKGHIKALKELLTDYPDVPYHNIVVFSERAKLKIDTKSEVIYASHLISSIARYTQPVLTPSQVEAIYPFILSQNKQGRNARKEHVETIHSEQKRKTLSVAELICPRCEGELVERKGKYGTFLGCSNYPKCRFVEKERKVVGINTIKR